MIEHEGAKIQLLDLPGIIEGASEGKGNYPFFLSILINYLGRGRQVIAVAKTADLVLMMLDATKGDKQVYSS